MYYGLSNAQKLPLLKRDLARAQARRPKHWPPQMLTVAEANIVAKIRACEKALENKGPKEGGVNSKKAERKAAKRAARKARK